MSEWRPIIFIVVLITCGLLQTWRPRRANAASRQRLFSNFGLMFSGAGLLWLVVPAGAVAAALWAQQQSWGLLTTFSLATPLALLLSIVALDCAIYWQHRAMHRWPLLWRLHRCHHSDLHLDTSTAVRFHPIEILLSMLYKMGVVIVLGASAEAVLLYEVLLSSFALYNHSNWAMPADRWLRKIIVTPDVHRVHHSVIETETNSNYGNLLVCWDKLFGSYTAQPRLGHLKMQIGLEQYRDPSSQKLLTLLFNPLRK